MNNSAWAHCLIDQLIQQGAFDFCLSPGSRCTVLALAIARHPKARLKVHFDERGAAFYALGLTQPYRKPAVLLTTSGTAVGNALPAVMEAHHSHLPLILLTADRPAELRNTCANQTTDQVKIFQNFTRWHADLPCPHPDIDERYIRSEAAYAVFQALQGGPVHLNCQFREPLFEEPQLFGEGSVQPHHLPRLCLNAAARHCAEELLARSPRGLILIGRLPAHTPLEPIFALARRLRWPIFADLLSQARCFDRPPELLTHYDYAVRTNALPKPDTILHFGERFTWKFLPQWVAQLEATILHVDPQATRVDPLHTRPHRFQAEIGQFCRAVCLSHPISDWLPQFQAIDKTLEAAIEESFAEPHPFTEADMMREIGRQMPAGWSLFLASSMPIRDAEHFLFGHKPRAIFCNRGLAGIDGQIATAAGIAEQLESPLLVILGDQSTLHDLNSLPLLKNKDILFVLSNNFGSGIFSYLPICSEKEHFDLICAAPHSYRFDKAAALFDIPYRTGIDALFSHRGIAEIFTCREKNTCFQKQILEKCSSAIQKESLVLSHS